MRENRVSKKKYQNKSTPQIIMSESHNSQFICSEIMTMHNTRFYIKIRWGAIFLAFVLFSCIIEFTFQHAKTAGPQGDAETALGNFAHIQMSFLLFSGFILYKKGLEQPELFIFVAVELFSAGKNIQF